MEHSSQYIELMRIAAYDRRQAAVRRRLGMIEAAEDYEASAAEIEARAVAEEANLRKLGQVPQTQLASRRANNRRYHRSHP